MNVRLRVEMAARHAGLRLATLADELGLARSTLHEGLARNAPTYKHLARIAERCAVSVAWLRTGDPEHAPTWAPSVPAPITDQTKSDTGNGPDGAAAASVLALVQQMGAALQSDTPRADIAAIHQALATAASALLAGHTVPATTAPGAATTDVASLLIELAKRAAAAEQRAAAAAIQLDELRSENRSLLEHLADGHTLPPIPPLRAGA